MPWGPVISEMEILRKNQKEMLVIKTTGTEIRIRMPSVAHLTVEKRISELEDISKEASKIEKQRQKKKKKKKTEKNQNRISKNCGITTKIITNA